MFYRIILAACLTAALGQAAHAEDLSPEKQAEKKGDIKRLITVTSGGNMPAQFANVASRQLYRAIKNSRPDFPERAEPIINRELLAVFSERTATQGGLLDQLVPVYDKYFTHSEIRELLKFYQTPLGKKTLGVMPKVMTEAFQARARWIQSMGPDINRRVGAALKKEGLMPVPDASAPAPMPEEE